MMKKRNWWCVGAFAGAVAIMAVRVLSEFGGFTHPESNAFLRVYNDCSRPVYRIIYDPLVTDWNAYQARELSYFVDWIDARFIYFCASLGMAHFYGSISSAEPALVVEFVIIGTVDLWT